MKITRFFFLVCLYVLFFSLQAGNNRQYEGIIKKYDIAYLLPSSEGSAEDFWSSLENRHEGLYKYRKALAKKKKTAVEANYDLNMALARVEPRYSEFQYLNDAQAREFASRLNLIIEGNNSNRLHFHLIFGLYPNAFCTPRGHIYIYHTLVTTIEGDASLLVGICAHEAAHYYLRHSARHLWAQKKEERKNNILAGISVGLMAASETMNAYNAGYYGYNYNSNLPAYISTVLACAKYDNNLFYFKYGREQELEADIVAYRFLEYVGMDPMTYVRALMALGTDSDEYYDDWSDHPTISYRIGLLMYLGEHYPLKSR